MSGNTNASAAGNDEWIWDDQYRKYWRYARNPDRSYKLDSYGQISAADTMLC